VTTVSATTHDVRILEPGELRAASDLFAAALLAAPVPAADWDRTVGLYGPDRTLGVHLDGDLVGTTTSFAAGVVVPGGAELSTAAVTRVGVRADRTRRGVLSSLMRRQLVDQAAAGDVLASLRATETGIYGRFGYGVATRSRKVRVTTRGGAGWRSGAPLGGDVRMVPRAEVLRVVTALYPQVALGRPGAMTRPEPWWRRALAQLVDGTDYLLAAVHTGPHGDDGFLVATIDPGSGWLDRSFVLHDLHAADPAAEAGLWRFALGVDLTVAVTAAQRPLDDPLELLLADPRDCATTGVDDETWLRILDVPAALGARTFAPADPVLLGVRDPLLPANDGVYRIADGGAERVGDLDGPLRPQLSCDVAGLAMAYLGDRGPGELVASGWWTTADPDATAAADQAFRTPRSPYAGTNF
jgi:predicted acetyltransferase